MKFQKRVHVKIPEGIEFSMPVADPLVRGIALLIDFFVKVVLSSIVSVFTGYLALLFSDMAQTIGLISGFIIFIWYPVICEWWWRGQTPGKRVMKLRVVDARGLNLTFAQILIRNLLRFVDMLPMGYVLGGCVALFSRTGQRLGDIAGGTVVVCARKVFMPNIEELMPAQYNSLRDYAYVTARLRQLTSPQEALLLANSILRREELEPQARLNVFSSLRSHFEQKARYPENLTVGMSDEQYIRNVADILFR